MDAGTILDLVTVALLAVGVMLWRSFGAGVEQAARDQATEVVSQLNWPATLSRELEQIRGTERQELRFESYGKLWTAMRPLAIYDDAPVNRDTISKLSRTLSDWYFSEKGGLMLTKHNRDLYFALQDLLRITGSAQQDWSAERAPKPEVTFDALLKKRRLQRAGALRTHLRDARPRDWPGEELQRLTPDWRAEIATLAAVWEELDERTRFAVLQQVSSALRTGLTNDVESRLR
jgi:hypothetical protein